MSGRDSEDNTTAESSPGTTTDMFKDALFPVSSQLTNLNANVSSVPLDRHDKPDEVDKNAGGLAKSADVDANLSAPSPQRERIKTTWLCREMIS